MEKRSRRRPVTGSCALRMAAAAAGALLFVLSCASQPVSVPPWTVHTPEPDATDTFFTGAGVGQTAAEAFADAQSNLIASVMQYMGTQVNVQTNATAKASLDSYQAELTQSVSTESSGRLVGFRVKDKQFLTDKKNGRVQAYILAAYSTAELSKERMRIAELAREKIDAVAVPESAGDSLVADARAYQSIRKYLEAAVAACAPGVDNSRQKVERNLSKARGALALLHLSIDGPKEGVSGKAPEKPFTVFAFSASVSGSADTPAAEVPVNLSLPRKLTSGKTGARTELLRTGTDGRAIYAAAAPDFTGASKVSASLDLRAELELAYSLPKEYVSIVSAFENDIASKTVDIDWKIVSAARGVPLAIAIYETDEKGYAAADRPFAGALQETLKAEGFTVSQVASLPYAALVALDDVAILSAARAGGVQSTAARLCYGVAKIDSMTRDGSMFIASASGVLRTLDIATGSLLHAASRNAQGLGATETAAARAALTALGKTVFGKELVSSLP